MSIITQLTNSRFFRFAIITSLLCLVNSCDWEVRILKLEDELRKFKETQTTKDREQDQRVEELASKIECDNPEIRNFIKKCTSDELCDEGKVVSAVRVMRDKDHVMLRLPYSPDKPLEIKSEDRRALLFTMFHSHQMITGITKLLVVAIPSLEKSAKGVKGGRPVSVKPQIMIDYTKLKSQALKFRNSLYEPDYNLPRTVRILDPQVPRCDSRTEGLVQIFHNEVPKDQLLQSEKTIQSPYVDLLIFLLEC